MYVILKCCVGKIRKKQRKKERETNITNLQFGAFWHQPKKPYNIIYGEYNDAWV